MLSEVLQALRVELRDGKNDRFNLTGYWLQGWKNVTESVRGSSAL